jgi:tripartite-type tricarboxylate transporter receptor subunit TctC
MLVVKPSLPAKNVAELVAYAKANPGKLNFASNGRGGAVHLTAELFMRTAGIQMTHIIYKGSGPSLQDLMSDAVDLHVQFDPIVTLVPHVKDGRLRALGVTSPKRSAVAPDVRAMADPELRQKFQALGFETMAKSPEEATAYIRTELTKWSGLLKEIGIEPQ